MPLYKARAPALPLPPVEYDQQQQDQLQYALRIYFNRLDGFLTETSTPQYGTTADRPVVELQIGQQYFDTTLGYPIWYDGTDWVDAAGTVV
jgi:hypothetical protein